MGELAVARESGLRAETESPRAELRLRVRQLFGINSESRPTRGEAQPQARARPQRPRSQQPGKPSPAPRPLPPGRRGRDHRPAPGATAVACSRASPVTARRVRGFGLPNYSSETVPIERWNIATTGAAQAQCRASSTRIRFAGPGLFTCSVGVRDQPGAPLGCRNSRFVSRRCRTGRAGMAEAALLWAKVSPVGTSRVAP